MIRYRGKTWPKTVKILEPRSRAAHAWAKKNLNSEVWEYEFRPDEDLNGVDYFYFTDDALATFFALKWS